MNSVYENEAESAFEPHNVMNLEVFHINKQSRISSKRNVAADDTKILQILNNSSKWEIYENGL